MYFFNFISLCVILLNKYLEPDSDKLNFIERKLQSKNTLFNPSGFNMNSLSMKEELT